MTATATSFDSRPEAFPWGRQPFALEVPSDQPEDAAATIAEEFAVAAQHLMDPAPAPAFDLFSSEYHFPYKARENRTSPRSDSFAW